MSKDFQEYKRQKDLAESYETAGKVQEAIALTICRPGGGEKQYDIEPDQRHLKPETTGRVCRAKKPHAMETTKDFEKAQYC